MQSAASDLDTDRIKRLAALEEREKAEREADESARRENSKWGGRGGFINKMNKSAGELDLAERMRRGKGGRTFVSVGGDD